MIENISFKMGVTFAASLNMGKNLCLVLYKMSYNQHELYQHNQKMMVCEFPLEMIHVSLILHHNNGYELCRGTLQYVFFILFFLFFT